MVLTPSLPVKDTCFYTEQIKGSSFVATKKGNEIINALSYCNT